MTISIEDRLFDIAPDILGLRLPMPPPLEWVNAYFLKDTKGWVMVDTGYNTPDSREVLQKAIADHLGGLPITGVIGTHYHPDHIGQAGWLCETFNCPLSMSTEEWLLARWLSTDHSTSYPEVITQYYRDTGAPDDLVAMLSAKGNTFLRTADEIPARYNKLVKDQVLKIGNREWQVLIGAGHSPEMVMLYDKAGKLLITGDQLVSRITPNISVWAYDQEANPLKDFLFHSRNIPELVPNDVTILPGHGRPFDNFHERIGTYIPFHDKRLDKLRSGFNGEPQNLYALMKVLYPRELTARDFVFAMGETHAHVNYLVGLGEIEKLPGSILQFQKKA